MNLFHCAHNRAHLINVGFCWPHKTTPKSAKYNWQPLRVSTISVIYNNKSVTVMHLNFVFIYHVHIFGGRWKRGVRFVTRTRSTNVARSSACDESHTIGDKISWLIDLKNIFLKIFLHLQIYINPFCCVQD